jgi:hypothetical protein
MERYDLETLEGLEDVINRLSYSEESEENEKLALKCIQKAQFFKDSDLEFDARSVYIHNVTFLNKHNLAIAMFPWLLKKCDEDRERYNYYSTLWKYKWIINNVRDFAKVSLEKMDELLADFEQRYKDYGTGDKVIHYFKLQYFDAIGDLEKAADEYALYQKASSANVLDDCEACQPNNLIDYLVSHEKYAEALKIAEPIVRGSISCATVPGTTYPKLILPALLSGKWEDAGNFAVLARKKLKLNQANLREAAHLITYYTLKEDFTKGRTVIEKQFPHILRNASDVNRFYFYLAGKLFFGKMKDRNKKSIKLNLPAGSPLSQEANVYTVDEVLGFFEQQLITVSKDLDQRNRNLYYTHLIRKRQEDLAKLAAEIPKE